MNSKQYFIIIGTIFLVTSILFMFVPTSKTDLLVSTTISNQVLKSPSIEVTNGELIPNTIINLGVLDSLKTGSIFDVFESGELKIEIIADGKTKSENIGTITITDTKQQNMRITNINPQLTKFTINLYENNVLKDTKEVTL